MLRRKGSLKVKNEVSGGPHKFAIKPISIATVKSQVAQQQGEDESARESEQVENKEPDGGGGG